MKGRIIFILFFGAFAAFAVGFFVFKTLPMLDLWYQAKSWNPTSATIINTALKENRGDDSITYKVTAKYQYKVLGQTYSGNKVSVTTGSDNIGSYHQDMHRYLKTQQQRGQPVTVWFDPQQPELSVIDKKMRWGLLLFESLFFVLFGLIGFGGLYFGFSKQFVDDLQNNDPNKPWLSKKYWANRTVLSNAKYAHKTVLVFAVIWNLLSVMAYIAVYQAITGEAEPTAFIAIVFPIVGLVLIKWYFSLKRSWDRIGATPLTLDPYPGSIGGQVGGFIDVRNPSLDRNKLLVKLTCLKNTRSGDSTRQSVVWQRQLVPALDATYDGGRISFCFDVDSGMPESQERNYPFHEWQVTLDGELSDGTRLDRQYEIPVFPTSKSSSIRDMKARADNQATKLFNSEQVDLHMPLKIAADGSTLIEFEAGRSAILSTILVLIGGVLLV